MIESSDADYGSADGLLSFLTSAYATRGLLQTIRAVCGHKVMTSSIPDCPTCRRLPSVIEGLALSRSYRCADCGRAAKVIFACSDVSALKAAAHECDAETVLANTNIKLFIGPDRAAVAPAQ